MQRSSSPRGAESRWPGQLAAIDMGSNSFRLEIGQLQRGRYRRLDYLKETVRLGAGLDAAGFLNDEAAARGLDCLARFARRLREIVEEAGVAAHQRGAIRIPPSRRIAAAFM